MKNSLECLRRKRGLLQKDVAAILGIPNSTYASYEQGQAEAGHEILKRLARLYGVSIDMLLSEPRKPREVSRKDMERISMAFQELSRALSEAELVNMEEPLSSDRYASVQSAVQKKP